MYLLGSDHFGSLPQTSSCAVRAMVLVSADAIWDRTVELLADLSIDLLRVSPPVPRVFPSTSRRKVPDYKLTHGERALTKEMKEFFDPPVLMWEVDRPEFVIDELPY